MCSGCHHSDQQLERPVLLCKGCGLHEPRDDYCSELDQREWRLSDSTQVEQGGGQDPVWAELVPGFDGVLGPILGVPTVLAGVSVSKEGWLPTQAW